MSTRAFLALALVAFAAGCGSHDDDHSVVTDAATDAVADTYKPPVDAAEAGPLLCEEPLATDFACKDPVKGTGGTACSEAALADFVQKCLADDITVPSTCAAWKTANADCAACIGGWTWDAIPGKVYPDDYKCYWATMDAPCAKSVNCGFECQELSCGECDSDPGTAEKSDREVCLEKVSGSGGACWSFGADKIDECFTKFDTANCNVDEIYADSPDIDVLRSQILRFYRGACRDNGDWTNSGSAGDAGATDAAETGAEAGGEAGAATDAADAD
ncbi:MAG: hypothetical protein HYV09_33410 [Deltaproteobacteria bacterium]|nr:hypothetical protein [Deltaproteobacteria bacterium]